MSNKELISNVYASFGRGDIPAVLASFSPTISWSEAEGNPMRPGGEPCIGPDAVVREIFAQLGGDWQGFTVKVQHLWDAGETVVMEGRYTGKYKASGQSIDAQVCHVWTVRDGKIARFQQYTDTAQFQAVMGKR